MLAACLKQDGKQQKGNHKEDSGARLRLSLRPYREFGPSATSIRVAPSSYSHLGRESGIKIKIISLTSYTYILLLDIHLQGHTIATHPYFLRTHTRLDYQFDRSMKPKNTTYAATQPSLQFYVLRSAQFVSSGIVTGILSYFVSELSRAHAYIPWTYLLVCKCHVFALLFRIAVSKCGMLIYASSFSRFLRLQSCRQHWLLSFITKEGSVRAIT